MAKQSTSWKNLERKTAKKLGGVRISRGNDFSKSDLDVLHPRFAIENKYRQKWGFIKHYDKLVNDARRLYPKEKKIPVLVVKEANRVGEFVIISLDDFGSIVKEEILNGKDSYDN